MDSCKIEIYECPVLFLVIFVPSLGSLQCKLYHIYSLSTNEARREKRYGIFGNFCFLKFFSNNRCQKPERLHWQLDLLLNGLQKVE